MKLDHEGYVAPSQLTLLRGCGRASKSPAADPPAFTANAAIQSVQLLSGSEKPNKTEC